MKYSQEEQDKILRKINTGVVGKRLQRHWDMIGTKTQWSKSKVMKELKNYTSLGDFAKNSNGAYLYAKRHNFLDEITLYLKRGKRVPYTLEEVKKIAKKYKTRGEFERGEDSTAWQWAQANGKLDEGCSHMIVFKRRLTKEQDFEIAKQCKTRTELYKLDSGAYSKAHKEKWLDELFPKK